MPDQPKPISTTEIDKLLNVDPNEVAQVGIVADLKKGIADGFSALKDLLLKARPAPEPDEPEDDSPEPDGDEGKGEPGDGDGDEGAPAPGEKTADPEDPEDKKGPGYDDMRLGKDGEIQVDATEYLLGLEAKVDGQGKMLARLQRDNVRLQKAVLDGQAETREMIAALGNAMAPMAKGILTTHQSMLDIPAAVHDPGRIGRNAAAKVALDAARKNVDARIDTVTLAKGLKNEIITEAQKQRFQTTGAFVTDEAENAAIVTRLIK